MKAALSNILVEFLEIFFYCACIRVIHTEFWIAKFPRATFCKLWLLFHLKLLDGPEGRASMEFRTLHNKPPVLGKLMENLNFFKLRKVNEFLNFDKVKKLTFAWN